MKTLLFASATLALLSAENFSPATQRADTGATTARYEYQYGSARGLIEPLEVDWV